MKGKSENEKKMVNNYHSNNFTNIKKMKKVIELYGSFIVWAKRQTEFYIAILATIIWFAFWAGSMFLGTETYPVGYFQKIAFGILAMSIISGVTFYWLKKTQPHYADLLDPDTQGGINNISEWERIKVGLFWFAWFGGGVVLLASLY